MQWTDRPSELCPIRDVDVTGSSPVALTVDLQGFSRCRIQKSSLGADCFRAVSQVVEEWQAPSK